jgi:hypothetical protein
MQATTMRSIAKRVLPRRSQLRLLRLVNTLQSLRPRGFSFPAASRRAAASPFPFPVSRENPLEQLGAKYAPTKRQHDYLIYYWLHFRDVRLQVRNVLEIGLQTDRSIRMWEEFFPNATIHGLDIDPQCEQFAGERRRVHVGDQSDEVFLRQVLARADGPFDIVIDDGSHRVEHQMKSFEVLFPALSEHGIYVVEDTGGVVADYNLRTVNALKRLVDAIMYWPRDMDPGDWAHLATFPEQATWIDRSVIGIAFYRYIVFILRGRNPEDNPFSQPAQRG